MRSQTSPPSSPKLELSLAQVIGSAAATISAAVLTSFAGVKGTLIGVAVMSVVATSGTAVYSHALRRSHTRLRHSLASLRSGGPFLPPLPRPSRRGGFRLALLAAPFVVFGLAFGVITVVEAIAGAPLSHVVSGQGASGGTTLSHAATGGGGGSRPRTPSTTVTPRSSSSSAAPTAGPESVSPRSAPSTAASPGLAPTRSSPPTVQRSQVPTSGATSPFLRAPAVPQPSSPPAPSAPGSLPPSG